MFSHCFFQAMPHTTNSRAATKMWVSRFRCWVMGTATGQKGCAEITIIRRTMSFPPLTLLDGTSVLPLSEIC